MHCMDNQAASKEEFSEKDTHAFDGEALSSASSSSSLPGPDVELRNFDICIACSCTRPFSAAFSASRFCSCRSRSASCLNDKLGAFAKPFEYAHLFLFQFCMQAL